MSFSELRSLRPIEWILAVLFIVAPFYFHPNIGGTGFRIPNNIIVWSVASVIGFYSIYGLAKKHYFFIPSYFLLIALFPILAFFSGMISGVEIANDWTFRILYIWGGLLFFFSLFQYQLKQGRIDRLLFMLVIAGLLHALVGLVQIIWLKNSPTWLPQNASGMPTGLFQQINNQASFQVTAIMISLWLITRPFIRKASVWRFCIVLLALTCAVFIVSYSGSRVGVLGFILATPLILVSRWQEIKQDKKRWWLIAVIVTLTTLSSSVIEFNHGLSTTLEKTTAMNAGFSGSTRLSMYAITVDVIKERPILGHGIGSFIRVWQLAKPAFYAVHPDAILPNQRVAHPHNEIILWLVEGGIVALIGLLAIVIAVMLSLVKLPFSRRYAYAAFLLPIALHTQVELPFYISASHWFVFLLLLYVVMRPSVQQRRLNLSNSARQLVKLIAIFGTVSSITFLSFSMVANIEFKRYLLKQTAKHSEPFSVAMHHPYFKELATQTMMTALFNSSMHYGLKDNVRLFAQWGEQELRYNPHIVIYKLTVQAYRYLEQEQLACNIVDKATAIYPDDLDLRNYVSNCNLKIYNQK